MSLRLLVSGVLYLVAIFMGIAVIIASREHGLPPWDVAVFILLGLLFLVLVAEAVRRS